MSFTLRLLTSGALAAVIASPALAQKAGPNEALAPILACRAIENDAERLTCFDQAARALGGEDEAGEIVVVRREQIEQVERESFGLSVPGMSSLAQTLGGVFGGGERPEPAERPYHAAEAPVETAQAPAPAETPAAPATPAAPPATAVAEAPTPPSARAQAAQAARNERVSAVTGVNVVERTRDGEAELVVMEIARFHEFDYQRGRFHMENGQVWEMTETKRMRMPRNGEAEAHIRRLSFGGYVLRINGTGNSTRVRRLR